jgi:hypothetical protein
VWLPPATVAERYAWAREHPWLAACWFGMAIFPVYVLLGLEQWTFLQALLGGAGAATVCGVVIACAGREGARHRWGERKDADDHPAPTARRMLVRWSDRSLFWQVIAGLVGIALGLSGLLGLVAGGDRPVGSTLILVSSSWFAATAWHERRTRRRQE